MHKPDLYKHSNELQRRAAKETIDEFSNLLQWREDGRDSLLDIGTGTGDVLMDFLLPILPVNFQRLVGSDSSKEMVEYARQHYAHPKVSFEHFDIENEHDGFRNAEPFDHITSFDCMQWIHNQERALQHMYKLLKPGGDILLGFLIQNPNFDIYKDMSKDRKWAKYMTNVECYISPYQYSKYPDEKCQKLLLSTGFTENHIEIREKFYIYKGIDALKCRCKIIVPIQFIYFQFGDSMLTFHLTGAVTAVNPFISRIPKYEQNEFFDDYLKHMIRMGLTSNNIRKKCTTCRFLAPYRFMIVYAKK